MRVRKLEEQANVVEKLLAEIHDCEVQSFKSLIELFDGKTDVDLLRTAIAERKKILPYIQNFINERELEAVYEKYYENYIEQLLSEFAEKETTYQQKIEK